MPTPPRWAPRLASTDRASGISKGMVTHTHQVDREAYESDMNWSRGENVLFTRIEAPTRRHVACERLADSLPWEMMVFA